MSLEPDMTVVGYLADGRKLRVMFDLFSGQDRSLPPHEPRSLLMAPIGRQHDALAEYASLWYRTYTFKPTGRRAARVGLRSSNGPRLTRPRFLIEMPLFRTPLRR